MESATRITRHVPALDGLRGVAVLMVFFYHYGGGAQSSNRVVRFVGMLNKGGWVGVTLFFVLSGFLITGILWDSLRTPHWVRNFYMRRVLRIFPLYYLTVFIILVAGASQHMFAAGFRCAWIVAIFAQNLPYFQLQLYPIPAPIYHLWSLAVEEQFYLLWPLLLFLMRSRRNAILLCLATIFFSFLYRFLLWHHFATAELYGETLWARGGELAAGGWLALMWRSPRWTILKQFAPAIWFVSAGIFLFVSYRLRTLQLAGPGHEDQWIWGLSAVTITCSATLVMVMTPGLMQRFASISVLRWAGRYSFGIYVFHVLLMHIIDRLSLTVTHGRVGTDYNLVRLLIAAALTVAVAWLSFNVFERPLLRLKRLYPSRHPCYADSEATSSPVPS